MNEENTNQLVRSRQIEWKALPEPDAEGVFVKVLQFDKKTKRAPTFLLKFEAGATYPAHN
nr:anti-sigma factor [Acidobacteriota bacterium]